MLYTSKLMICRPLRYSNPPSCVSCRDIASSSAGHLSKLQTPITDTSDLVPSLLNMVVLNLFLVVVQNTVVDALGKDVHLGRRELASADALFEEKVQLCERSSHRLGDSEVCVDDAQETDSTLHIH